MEFPLSITATINTNEGDIYHSLELRGPLTFIIGPNGSGKTHLLKGLKNSFSQHTNKKVRFLSAGRLGHLEKYRSISGDALSDLISPDDARHGDKSYSKIDMK
ncbi:AAA family ATPase [Cardiobacterium valvarum]|uniref:AAA family ATPase n=1 Tax=Cardiobacterium valvarum TaxID=194702 RepID=UPI0035E97A0C